MDERYGKSIELSYEELKKTMVQCGFEVEEERRICTPFGPTNKRVGKEACVLLLPLVRRLAEGVWGQHGLVVSLDFARYT